ncbi:MAG: ABC transporter ATP-binding protein [Flavobacteriaceae bacterium]|nr:ABC transporter ATP-binding protein [Flavobacteriaceae bacterium]
MKLKNEHSVLTAKDLSIGYPKKSENTLVASQISFSLPQGSLTGLVGANGIGKSTLLRTLTGMQSPLSGSVQLGESDITSFTPFQLANQLSVVLTEPPASKNLSVIELISLGRQPYTNWLGTLSTTDKKAVLDAMEATETRALAHRKCFELSDGQLQRVAIARALAQDTPIIILDEPTTHLDLYHRAYVLKLLKKLASEKKKTILFSTHEIDLAIQLTDTLLVMAPGGTFFGEPCQLIEQGLFDGLFPKETIHFDKKTVRFSIKK